VRGDVGGRRGIMVICGRGARKIWLLPRTFDPLLLYHLLVNKGFENGFVFPTYELREQFWSQL